MTQRPFTLFCMPLQWSEVQSYLTRPTDKPVVLNRSSSTNSSNPFGSTYCYGYQNVIFEVHNNKKGVPDALINRPCSPPINFETLIGKELTLTFTINPSGITSLIAWGGSDLCLRLVPAIRLLVYTAFLWRCLSLGDEEPSHSILDPLQLLFLKTNGRNIHYIHNTFLNIHSLPLSNLL